MPFVVIIVVAAPIFIMALALYLTDPYGDKLFGLNWPGHDLNNPDDPRLIKLKLEVPKVPEQSERGLADR